MRYSRQEDLLRLAVMMQGSAEGVSIADIEQTFGVSRRTAERMRDAVLRAFPQLEERPGVNGQKYWRFPTGTLGKMVEPTVDELTAGHRAASIARREGDLDAAETLERLLSKVQAMFREDRRRRIAADLEAQLMADGVAFRPGPRERIDPEILRMHDDFRTALVAKLRANAGQLFGNDFADPFGTRQNIHQIGDLFEQLGKVGNDLVAFETGQALQTQFKNRLRLRFG